MPGWHEGVRDLVRDGKLVLLGVTQEQHAERCVLFAKWKGFEWPILHDPINLLGCRAVPLTFAIDEQGVVRSTRPTLEWVRNEFVRTAPAATRKLDAVVPTAVDVDAIRKIAKEDPSAESLCALGDAIMLWTPQEGSTAVAGYSKSLKLREDPVVRFRLGVALRQRYESQPGNDVLGRNDFDAAVKQWMLALKADPNQYIWRRRIQQYGPRLDKPYPFYDWVAEAKAALVSRGEIFELKESLSGAEIAQPRGGEEAELGDQSRPNPDPEAKVTRDLGRLVTVGSTIVPSSQKDQRSVRLHLTLKPTKNASWNNEVEPVQVWFSANDGYETARQWNAVECLSKEAESNEIRTVEAEFTVSAHDSPRIEGFMLYHVCEKSSGQCIFRRQDFSIPTKIE